MCIYPQTKKLKISKKYSHLIKSYETNLAILLVAGKFHVFTFKSSHLWISADKTPTIFSLACCWQGQGGKKINNSFLAITMTGVKILMESALGLFPVVLVLSLSSNDWHFFRLLVSRVTGGSGFSGISNHEYCTLHRHILNVKIQLI